MTLTASSRESNQFAVTIAFLKDNDHLGETHVLVEFVMRYAFYAALTALLLMFVALILKLMGKCNGDDAGGGTSRRPTENTRLSMWSKDDHDARVVTIYGTNGKRLESGSTITSSSKDLYDGKTCVICYDNQRNCFFVPCGHCVACHNCAHRIINEESKSCPICRGIIDKVRILHFCEAVST